ncbi:hypothetical protein ACFFGH_11095 [Lysobacter korlensis]|uniref:Integral membrane protein n=1 Tax=Lysobacter korlensis TaxID=553636 RepID=A0ABV6RN50_9GAMM
MRRSANPAVLFTAATVSYAANCLLGVSVATRLIDTSRVRWVHHGMYIATSALAAAAGSSLVWSRSKAGWVLLPAAVPLAVIPYAGTRGRRHPAVALSAAPFFLASLITAWRR